MEKISYITAPIKNKTPEKEPVTIKQLFDGITGPSYKARTLEFREHLKVLADLKNEKDMLFGDDEMSLLEEYENKIKKQEEITANFKATLFDYTTPSGIFSYVSKSNLEKYSSIICFDFDHIDNVEEVRNALLSDRNIPTTLLFTSPSGEGVKWFVRFKLSDESDHLKNYLSIENYMKTAYNLEVDKACKDVSRACYLCWDEQAVFNKDAKPVSKAFIDEWTPEMKTYANVSEKVVGQPGETPWDLYNKSGEIHKTLTQHGYKQVSVDKDGTKYLRPNPSGKSEYSLVVFNDTNLVHNHSSGDPVLDPGTYTPANVFTKLTTGGDWSAAASALKDLGFVKYTKGLQKTLLSDEKKAERESKRAQEAAKLAAEKAQKEKEAQDMANKRSANREEFQDSQVPADIPVFWDTDKKGNVKISEERLFHFIAHTMNLWAIPELAEGGEVVFHVEDNMIEKKDIYSLFREVRGFFKNKGFDSTHPELFEKVMNALGKPLATMIKASFRQMFCLEGKVRLNSDDAETAYLYFRNGVVKITKDKINLLSYKSLKGLVWKHSVIDRDFDSLFRCEKGDFFDFCKKTMANDPERLKNLMRGHGYLLHSYKNKGAGYAIIFTDEKFSVGDAEANGGTGKSIACDLVKRYRETQFIDGTNFMDNPRFRFAQVTKSTKILYVDEVPSSGLEVKELYNVITGDFQIERKRIDPLVIPFSESPKILVATNYPLVGTDASDLRRIKVAEFHWTFSKDHTVRDEYGYSFFGDDAPEDFWKGCDAYAVASLQEHLRHPMESRPINYRNKEAIRKIGGALYDFFESTIEIGRKYTASELMYSQKPTADFNGFANTPDYDRSAGSRNIRKYFKIWGEARGYHFDGRKSDAGRLFWIEEKK